MMRLLCFILLVSCAHKSNQVQLKNMFGLKTFDYTDQSGEFFLKREIKKEKDQLISRVKLYSKMSGQELESTLSVSKLGNLKSNKAKRALLPVISQFRVWFNKKEHFSQIKVNKEKRVLEITARGPLEKWNFTKSVELQKGSYLCFFSQLPECLKAQNLLLLSADKKVQLFIIWDNYPFHNEQFDGLNDTPVVMATIKLDEHNPEELKYAVDVGNQSLFYHFNKKLDFKKMFWISQGMSMIDTNKD